MGRGLLLGAVVGLLWPVTLWVALGVWWHRRAENTPIDVADAATPPRRARAPRIAVVAACATASLVTLAALGAAAPTPAAVPASSSAADSAPAADPAPPTNAATATGRVIEVIDGDTVVVDRGTDPVTVRLLGIDAPETWPTPECWAAESTAFAESMLLGREVWLDADPTQDAEDRDGRTLAYAVLSEINYSVAAADAGAARSTSSDGPVAMHAEIAAAQERARSAERGLWSCAAGAPAPVQAAPASERPATVQPAAAPPASEAEPRPQRVDRPEPEPEPAPAPEPELSGCDPNYSGCVPIASDVDCEGGSGNGPAYARGPVEVIGDDIYDLDSDGNGIGCE